MKFLRSFLFAAAAVFFVVSCEKEYSLEDNSNPAAGTLKSDTFGDCLPSSVNGIYKADSTLGSANYIEVQVNVTTAGTYSIASDTVNGYYFKGAGAFAAVGLNTIRLQGSGKPLNAGTNDFIVSFNGSVCFMSVTVMAANASIASFTLGGAPGACTGATAAGTYTQGVALTSSNTLTVSVNVTAMGAYTLGAASTNGMFFSAAGVFGSLGPQSITLNGSGTPTTSGAINVTAGNLGATCTFSIPVQPASGSTAVFTLGGAPNACTPFSLAGTYQSGLAMSASNTVTFNVTVVTPGTYNVTANTVNGVTFSGAGTLTAGSISITLTASGTPAAATTSTYNVTAGASTCSFPVTYTAATGAAVFTLAGAPGSCTPATVAGTYTAGTALTSSNTVTISANVTTIGTYSVTTAAVNGMTFSATGAFTGTGPQSIVLMGTGTPATASATNTFTPGSGSTCTFNINVSSAGPTNFITCSVNGTAATFNQNIQVTFDATTVGVPLLEIYGETVSGSDPSLDFGILSQLGTPIVAGTYTVNQLTATGMFLGAYYFDAASTEFNIESAVAAQTPGFTITITSITATRVTGTFSGTVKDPGNAISTKVITNGAFSVPY